MTARTRRRLLLLGGLVAAAGLVGYVRSGDDPAGPGPTPSNRSARGASATRVEVPVVDLRLERLTPDPDALAEPKRDPFRFRPTPAPPPPVDPRPAAPAVVAPPPPSGPPPPPRIPLKFFGVAVTTEGDRIASFVDARGNVMTGKEGAIIEGRYRILRIGTESAELAYLDGGGRQSIRLTGQ